MASATTTTGAKAQARRRTGGPIDPSPYSVLTTLCGALIAIVLAIQATDTLGRTLAWTAIVGHVILGATEMLSVRYEARSAGSLRHAWTAGVVLVGTCEFLAAMVVWGGLHL